MVGSSPQTTAPRPRPPDAGILPEGGHGDLPAGRRQVGLASLLALLTVASVVLAVGRLMGCGPPMLLVLLGITIGAWWQYAQFRDLPSPNRHHGSEELREEIRQWKDRSQGR